MVDRSRLPPALLLCGLFISPAILSARPQGPAENKVVVRFRAGQQSMQAGRFDQAVEDFKEVLRLQPDLVEARVDLGLAYHALGQYALAVSELREAASRRADLLSANLFL